MFNLNSVCPKKAKYYIIWWNHWVGVTEGIRKQILITNPDLPYFSQSCTWKANKSWFLARFVSVTLSIMPQGVSMTPPSCHYLSIVITIHQPITIFHHLSEKVTFGVLSFWEISDNILMKPSHAVVLCEKHWLFFWGGYPPYYAKKSGISLYVLVSEMIIGTQVEICSS